MPVSAPVALWARRATAIASLLAFGGCAFAPGVAGSRQNAPLVQGPPIQDIVTPYDQALSCLDGKVSSKLTFAVGAIADKTGKESYTEGGTGKFVTQGAGDIVQSALFKAGASVVNRRDPAITATEINWQLKSARNLAGTNFYITGSVNSLDFIPGSGAEVSVAGIGPRYRQNRILVGLDLALTEANSSRIVANVPLQKQIFASEGGVGLGRFFGEALVTGDIGGREREALNRSLRNMLNLATFDLLTQVMPARKFKVCREKIDEAFGTVTETKSAEKVAKLATKTKVATASAAAARPPVGRKRLPPPPDDQETKSRADNGEKLIRRATSTQDDEASAASRAKAQAILND